ncbi:hypothetical protein L596_030049 [Steinernema carpocapsae]|uniref:MBOAT family protein n=1 Tax=Steinernema carpocapsae TaxID=34508 RepID=A0A4U5LRK9_STECR|nr:hypothetical protein L596_030049 [Steinernema carpocapsae]
MQDQQPKNVPSFRKKKGSQDEEKALLNVTPTATTANGRKGPSSAKKKKSIVEIDDANNVAGQSGKKSSSAKKNIRRTNSGRKKPSVATTSSSGTTVTISSATYSGSSGNRSTGATLESSATTSPANVSPAPKTSSKKMRNSAIPKAHKEDTAKTGSKEGKKTSKEASSPTKDDMSPTVFEVLAVPARPAHAPMKVNKDLHNDKKDMKLLEKGELSPYAAYEVLPAPVPAPIPQKPKSPAAAAPYPLFTPQMTAYQSFPGSGTGQGSPYAAYEMFSPSKPKSPASPVQVNLYQVFTPPAPAVQGPQAPKGPQAVVQEAQGSPSRTPCSPSRTSDCTGAPGRRGAFASNRQLPSGSPQGSSTARRSAQRSSASSIAAPQPMPLGLYADQPGLQVTYGCLMNSRIRFRRLSTFRSLHPLNESPKAVYVKMPGVHTFYDGSKLLEPLANAIGIDSDKVNLVFCQFASIALALFYYHKMAPGMVSRNLRIVFPFVVGLSFCYFCFGMATKHLVANIGISYVLMLVSPSKYVHATVFVFSMGYLAYMHWYRFFHLKTYSLDVTGPMMVICQKITTLAFSLYDGKEKKREELNEIQKREAITDLPPLLDYLSFMFNFQSVLTGPLSFYTDYIRFIDGENVKQLSKEGKKATPWKAAKEKLVQSVVFFVLILTVGSKVSPEQVADKEHMKMAWIPWMLFFTFAITMARVQYYFVWTLTDAICNLSGYGFQGYDKDGNEDWDLVRTVYPARVELALNFKGTIDNWNIATQKWLRRVAFDRLPGGTRTFGTYLLSAFWHGFFPGYYMAFLSAALFTVAGRTLSSSPFPRLEADEDCLRRRHLLRNQKHSNTRVSRSSRCTSTRRSSSTGRSSSVCTSWRWRLFWGFRACSSR